MDINRDLEVKLREAGTYDRFVSDLEAIQSRPGDSKNNKKYAHCIVDFLEMAVRYESAGINYVTLGGIAVLAHRMQENPDMAVEWRGTDDVDMLAEYDKIMESDLIPVMDSLGYQKPQVDNRQRNGIIGALHNFTKVNTPTDKLVVVGMRRGIELFGKDFTQFAYENREQVDFYGIPVYVAGVADLISMKDYAARCGRSKSKDKDDKKALKSILKARN
jgi:hypothetical protein